MSNAALFIATSQVTQYLFIFLHCNRVFCEPQKCIKKSQYDMLNECNAHPVNIPILLSMASMSGRWIGTSAEISLSLPLCVAF